LGRPVESNIGEAKNMYLSRPALHPVVNVSAEIKSRIREKVRAAALGRRAVLREAVGAPQNIVVPLTTVSQQGNFDAYVDISFVGAPPDQVEQLVVDSGNSMLIVPSWADISAIPNFQNNYQVLGDATEPWGCPAKVVRGPIRVGGLQINGCIFYACVGNGPNDGPTANFGAGCLSPWSASGWNQPDRLGVTMQAPLAYSSYTVAEFNYEATENLLTSSVNPKVSDASNLTLHKDFPQGYFTFPIVKGIGWMSLPLSARKLSIGSTATAWPDSNPPSPPIAMIDTGGGPVLLTDPGNLIVNAKWPDQVQTPWTMPDSINCHSIDDKLTIEIGDSGTGFQYTIDPSLLPESARGLTMVMCAENEFLRGNYGMNIGGLSALVVQIAVDYAGARVGLRPRQPLAAAIA
jgi:hypothetical protein